jgi:hypothetical protein
VLRSVFSLREAPPLPL